jgi:hypothetical protein
VCEGRANWFRQVTHDEVLVVLEGVVTLDGPGAKVIVNDGELAVAPRNVRHHVHSGMRSSVLLVEEVRATDQSNGHRTPDTEEGGRIDKTNLPVTVSASASFAWQPVATAGGYMAYASRLVGASAPYTTPAGSLVVLVYRGVLDYTSDAERGTVVGSQMLVVPPETHLTIGSERGATVVLLARKGAELPRLAAPAGSPNDGERTGQPEP